MTSKRKSQAHKDIIAEVTSAFPAAATCGFMKALAVLPDASYIPAMAVDDREWWQDVTFIPDAFLIDEPNRMVVVFEAVVTNDISDAKFAKMVDMAWALDQDEYDLCLVRCDRFNRVVFDVRGASILDINNRVAAGAKVTSYQIDEWQRYPAAHVLAALTPPSEDQVPL